VLRKKQPKHTASRGSGGAPKTTHEPSFPHSPAEGKW
jgi:hypothetical protein